jgi:hypothetical protein
MTGPHSGQTERYLAPSTQRIPTRRSASMRWRNADLPLVIPRMRLMLAPVRRHALQVTRPPWPAIAHRRRMRPDCRRSAHAMRQPSTALLVHVFEDVVPAVQDLHRRPRLGDRFGSGIRLSPIPEATACWIAAVSSVRPSPESSDSRTVLNDSPAAVTANANNTSIAPKRCTMDGVAPWIITAIRHVCKQLRLAAVVVGFHAARHTHQGTKTPGDRRERLEQLHRTCWGLVARPGCQHGWRLTYALGGVLWGYLPWSAGLPPWGP